MRRHAAILLALLILGAGVLDRAIPLDLSRARTLSPELDDSAGRVLNLRPAADGAIRLALMEAGAGPDIVPLLLAREDRRFGMMPGIDPLALLRATGQLIRTGRIISGGSTIAMQVARLLEPHPRTWRGKLHDMARAVQLEAHLGHREVLRLYLTLAPMGGGIEGMRAAALLYFGREPAALTRSQAALLVGLPQSPARRRPDRHPDAAWQAASRVLQMAGDPMRLEPTPIQPPVRPSSAPYLAGHSKTTLNGDLQVALEGLAAREVPWLGGEADMAALVVRNSDRAVLAYLGGAHFLGPAGMVDMVRARRSPGSALKPFIYAMAFDRGLATPDTLLEDGALRLGSYAPRDFDRADHGSVTASEALRQSLNRPSVRLLAAVGLSYFVATLRATGTRLRLPLHASPSAALALGGAGISLWDLAALYAGLATDGRVGSLHLDPAALVTEAAGFASSQAAALVASILRGQPPPPGAAADPGHAIAYKTGTSYGNRDAWAAGFTRGYTIVVWTGRRDNTPLPGFTGRESAAPLLFKIVALLPPEQSAPDSPQAVSLRLAPALQRTHGAAALRIMFPPGNVDLAYDPRARIDLRAAGGSPPYHWMIDNIPQIMARSLWVPSGPGFTHLTVTDSKGVSASEDVQLVAE